MLDTNFGLLQSIDGNHLCCYYSPQDLYLVITYEVLCFALARRLFQMPAAAHLILKTPELLLHGLQL